MGAITERVTPYMLNMLERVMMVPGLCDCFWGLHKINDIKCNLNCP